MAWDNNNSFELYPDSLEGLTIDEFQQLIECITPKEESSRSGPAEPPSTPTCYSQTNQRKARRRNKKLSSSPTKLQPPSPICSICGDTDTVSKAYKGLACFECRKTYYAFCGKKTTLPNVCSMRDNNCNITKLTRDVCGFCRLQKLYSIGYPFINKDNINSPKHTQSSVPNHSTPILDEAQQGSPINTPQLSCVAACTESNISSQETMECNYNYIEQIQLVFECKTCGCQIEKNDADCDNLICSKCRRLELETCSDIIVTCWTGRGECLLDHSTRGKCQYCRLRKFMALGLIDTIGSSPSKRSIETKRPSPGHHDIILGHKYVIVPQSNDNNSSVISTNSSLKETHRVVLRPVEITVKVAPPWRGESIPLDQLHQHTDPPDLSVHSDDSEETIVVD